MKNSHLLKEKGQYNAPACRFFLVGTQRVICGSFDTPIQGTEVVEEIDGNW